MHHDQFYKEIYLHCTKHCIHDRPHTKKPPRALSQNNKNVQKRKKMISNHFLYSSSFHLKMHISHPSVQKPTFFLIKFLNYYYCVIRQAEVTVSWSVRSQ